MSFQINPLETLYVNSKKVSCQGQKAGEKAGAGHPLVYLDMGKNDFVICPYCSKYFTVRKKSAYTSAGPIRTKHNLDNKHD